MKSFPYHNIGARLKALFLAIIIKANFRPFMKAVLIGVLTVSISLVYAQKETKKQLKYKPKNLDECMNQLDLMTNDIEKETILSMSEKEFAVSQHFGLGLYMRNFWGLWREKELYYFFNSLGISHPDYMSGIILVSYHRHLSQKDIDLNGQILELKNSIQEYEEKRNELYDQIRMQMGLYKIGDTLMIDFYLRKNKKYPTPYSVQTSQDHQEMIENYTLTPIKVEVVKKFFVEDTQQFQFRLKLIDLSGHDKIRLWHPFNNSKVGDVFDLTLNNIDFNSIKNISGSRVE